MEEQLTATAPQSEPAEPVQEAAPQTEPVEETPETGLEPGEVGMDEDNVLHFGKEFFGKQEPEGEPAEEPAKPETPPFYSVEDLGRTGLNEVDVNRLDPAKIRDYWGMVQRVMTQDRERIAGLEAQIAQMRQGQQEQPAQTVPQTQPAADRKAMTEAVVKRAREMLNLPEDEDLDLYEPEHQLAFAQAAQEVGAKAQAEQRSAASYAELQQFHRQMAQRPDFGGFNEWFQGQLQKNGRTPEQVQQGLAAIVQQHGGDFGVVRNVISNWYREYLAEKQGTQKPRGNAQKPPVLEGAGGGAGAGKKVFDLSKFGDMDAEGQVQVLKQMGLV